MNQKYFILKILSVISLFFVQVPGDKFDISFGFIILLSLIDVSVIFDIQFFMSLSYIIGCILLFVTNKRDLIISYGLIISSSIFFLAYVKLSKTGFLFWIPLFVFLGLSSIILYDKFAKRKN